jgi:ankyrin repeat protein
LTAVPIAAFRSTEDGVFERMNRRAALIMISTTSGFSIGVDQERAEGLGVRALVDGGADVRKPNKTGSTPLHLAVQTTGRGGSGSAHAREQQAGIVRFLLEHGARPTDRDRRGRSVHDAATSDWIRILLKTG